MSFSEIRRSINWAVNTHFGCLNQTQSEKLWHENNYEAKEYQTFIEDVIDYVNDNWGISNDKLVNFLDNAIVNDSVWIFKCEWYIQGETLHLRDRRSMQTPKIMIAA